MNLGFTPRQFSENLFICFWLCWVSAAVHTVYSAPASHCGGFSCFRAWALGHSGSVVAAVWAVEHWLTSVGARAQLLCGTWELPRSGIELVSPALAGGFFSTEPPGKPLDQYSFKV